MAPMVLDLVVIGLAIALNPLPLTAFMLVVASRNGAVKGAAYIFGWLLSLAIVASLTVAFTGNHPPRSNTAPTIAGLAVKMAIGAALLVIALRRWRHIGRPKPPKAAPKWQAGIDNMSPWFALALAMLLQPWGLIAAGVATITSAHLQNGLDYLVLILFCFLGTSTYLATEIYSVARPEQTQVLLARIRAWITTHTDQFIIIGALVVGFWLIGHSLYLAVSRT
jgi:hypothetical protein